MEKATLKQNIIREIVIALVCILIAISSTAFGAKAANLDYKGGGKKSQKKATMQFSADKIALFTQLEKEYQAELKTAKKEISESPNYKKVLVYDMAGNLLQEQDSQKATIDLDKLPKGAKLLTVDDDLAIYVVL